ncbi:Putative uncharacterized transposon-derived protein F52C9.6 [Eumeta japonica]|uniref:Uncharacterized transposon-derived protein F52C9.6 n=1 Tax=Eumeta variegata TaxID=151549 RepID=A0A4C1T692_EUMVA|nr:Putative uncharacterized transposon-derived protein F52C9.6 [Eumeta japonica]
MQEEIEFALEIQRDDKAPGPDGISNEVLKRAKNVITPILKDIFNDFIDSEAIPQQLTKSNIILLYKKCKAFDSLIHANIWEALREQGIEQKYIRLIRNVYKNSSACIQLEKKGDPFKIQKSVKQGDPLSPKLFSAVLEMTFKSFEWQNLCLNIDGRTLTHLRFADDIVLFAKTPDDLVRMLNELASESRKIGLKLNPEKTKVMTNGNKSSIKVGDSEIDYVDEYIDLGQLISPQDNINIEIERKVANSWKRY